MNRSFLKTLECPLTGNRMVDPVIFVSDGITYERQAIERWIEEIGTGPNGHPLPINKPSLVTNKVLLDIINAVFASQRSPSD